MNSNFSLDKIALYLFLLFANVYARAQTDSADSVLKVISQKKDDTSKVQSYLDLAKTYLSENPDKSIEYAKNAIDLSVKIEYKSGEGYGYKWLGLANKYKGKYFDALTYSNKSLTIFETLGDEVAISNLLNNLGAFFSDNGEDSKAAEYILKSLSLAQKSGDKHRIENTLGNLGVLYSKNPATNDKAIEYYLKALPYALEIKNDDESAILYTNLGEAYTTKGEYDSAFHYLQMAIKIYGYTIGAAYTFNDLGKLYIKKTLYDSAFQAFQKAFDIARSADSNIDLAQSYNGLASVQLLRGNAAEAIKLYKSSAELSKAIPSIPELKESYTGLAEAYKKTGDLESAYRYLNSLNDLYNTEYKEKLSFNTATLEYTMELQKQTGQIAQLMKENELQELLLEKEKLAKNASIAGIGALVIIAIILLRNIRQRKKLNQILYKQKEEIEVQKASVENALSELKSTQSQLIHSEKMASLGELTAGIAHEIQNPLNFVNNFSEVSNELIDEMQEELKQGNTEDALSIASDIKSNLEKILHHGKRADGIVKGMLQHSRSSTGQKEDTNLNVIAEEYLKLAYHGLRAKDKSFNASLNSSFDDSITTIKAIGQDIGRVILNLITNAFYAVNERRKTETSAYQPSVSVSTKRKGDKAIITVTDNGTGIPKRVLDKIFQPFFTTKPTGEGTGLGLSLSYDIVKAHYGDIKVDSKEGEGTTFTIELPIN